jgi:hypothetical protein
MDKEILYVEDVAAILNVKPNTIHSKRWQKKNDFPCLRRGKRLLVLKDDFWRWLKASRG